MKIVITPEEWLRLRTQISNSIGFVPTMGNLHAGHLSLCARALAENEVTVVSIFVNPAQFNDNNDFINYPRTVEADISLLKQAGVDYCLVFAEKSLYPDGYEVRVTENVLENELEGKYRHGHFSGVLTIVSKFLNLVRPARAYFGEKDYQQLLLIKKMVNALFVPVEIIACPTVREPDQLAMSSRNNRLTPAQRAQASHFPRVLHSGLGAEEIRNQLTSQGFKVDYVAEKWGRRLAAVWLDEIRLIDNIAI